LLSSFFTEWQGVFCRDIVKAMAQAVGGAAAVGRKWLKPAAPGPNIGQALAVVRDLVSNYSK
jgi:hypothetical protein